jgi:small conductance mechanosensitive channel
MVVATIHSLCANYAEDKTWHDYYQALEPLVPLLRKSLEYIIWIATATLVIAQLNPIAEFAKYGPRVIESIAIFFIARVFIDAGHLVIDNSQQQEDLDEMAQRRRATILPLFKTIFRYLTYFITLVLILSALGIDVMPFLAGAGILGVVIGFGAQPLINDIVSGFFILFENIFLVDDVIDTGTVLGKVESIDFRTTKVRDPDGNLHILRNGNLEHVKNYSKDFTFAVVEVRVGYDANVSEVREVLEACGKKVREALPDVITSDLDVKGIVEFEPSAMRFRTTTEVKPAKHFIVATRLREVIKAAFDEKGWVMPAEKHQVNVVANS